MDNRVDSVDSEAVLFFVEVLREKLVDHVMVDVKYIEGHLGQAKKSIQNLMKTTYKNQLLNFFTAHPEHFAVYGRNICLFVGNTSSKCQVPGTTSHTSAMPPVNTETVPNIAEEAAVGFISAAIHHRGPQSINRLCGQYSQMSLQMRKYVDNQKETSLQKQMECVLRSRPNIFGINSNGTVSLSGRPLWLKKAELNGLVSMCHHLIGDGHLHMDTLFNRLKQQCNHLLDAVLDDVTEDSLVDFISTQRDCFFVPDSQNVWNIQPHDRLKLQLENEIVAFFKQEIVSRGEGIDYKQLLHVAENSNILLDTKVKDSIHLGKILWRHENDFGFNEGKVIVIISESSDIPSGASPPTRRPDASQKAHELHGHWLSDYKGVISCAFKHTMIIMATLKDSTEDNFEVYCHCSSCEVVNGGETKDHLCQVLRSGDEVVFSAVYDDAVNPDYPNKPLWTAVRVAKI